MKIKIRKAKKEDLPHIIKLQSKLRRFHEKLAKTKDDKFYEKKSKQAQPAFKRFIHDHFKKKNFLLLLAYENKKPIAYSLSFIKENIPIFKIKRYGYISDIYIEEKYRGQGLGKKLLDLSKEFFKNKKVKYIELATRTYNKKALKLYQKYGFKENHITMRMRL